MLCIYSKVLAQTTSYYAQTKVVHNNKTAVK